MLFVQLYSFLFSLIADSLGSSDCSQYKTIAWSKLQQSRIFPSAWHHHVIIISDNTQVRKNYLDSNRIQKGNVTLLRCFLKDYITADVDRSKCIHATSSEVLFCTYVGNVNSVTKFLTAEAIRMTVVPIRILIRTTVVPIRIFIRTTECDWRSV